MKHIISAALLLGLPVAAAEAKTSWGVSKMPFLEAGSSEPESDADLRAICFGGLVTIRMVDRSASGRATASPSP